MADAEMDELSAVIGAPTDASVFVDIKAIGGPNASWCFRPDLSVIRRV
jgi:hypothetical protein